MHDVFMSAFAMMFFQDPSLLQFQQRLEDEAHTNNLKTLFHVKSIPKDTRMREIMDDVGPEEIAPLFDEFFRPLQRGKHLEQYQVLDGRYIIALDGSQYFTSEKISCPGCLIKEDKKGKVRFSHQIVQAAIMNPGMRQVIPLAPEEVKNTDGKEKQDCEINAGKRLLGKIRKSHPKLPLVIVADSLYSKQPTIEEITGLHMNYVLVAKPDDHKKLMEWVNGLRMLEEVRLTVKDKNRTHVYEWVNDVPLNDNNKTVMVNYFEYWIMEDERITYHNSLGDRSSRGRGKRQGTRQGREMPLENRKRGLQYAQESGLPYRAQLRPRFDAPLLQLLSSQPPRLLHAPDIRAHLHCLSTVAEEARQQEEPVGPYEGMPLHSHIPRHR